jgi:hypothetical protein
MDMTRRELLALAGTGAVLNGTRSPVQTFTLRITFGGGYAYVASAQAPAITVCFPRQPDRGHPAYPFWHRHPFHGCVRSGTVEGVDGVCAEKTFQVTSLLRLDAGGIGKPSLSNYDGILHPKDFNGLTLPSGWESRVEAGIRLSGGSLTVNRPIAGVDWAIRERQSNGGANGTEKHSGRPLSSRAVYETTVTGSSVTLVEGTTVRFTLKPDSSGVLQIDINSGMSGMNPGIGKRLEHFDGLYALFPQIIHPKMVAPFPLSEWRPNETGVCECGVGIASNKKSPGPDCPPGSFDAP